MESDALTIPLNPHKYLPSRAMWTLLLRLPFRDPVAIFLLFSLQNPTKCPSFTPSLLTFQSEGPPPSSLGLRFHLLIFSANGTSFFFVGASLPSISSGPFFLYKDPFLPRPRLIPFLDFFLLMGEFLFFVPYKVPPIFLYFPFV